MPDMLQTVLFGRKMQVCIVHHVVLQSVRLLRVRVAGSFPLHLLR